MDKIIHVGAGLGIEVAVYLTACAGEIILVEPNPKLADQLRKQTSNEPQVTVIEAAITTNPAYNQLYEYNLPEACGLHTATGLKKLFPGLKIHTVNTVVTLTPQQLLQEHAPEPGQSALLVLETPGEEYAIIKDLVNAGKLKKFSHIDVSANPEAYYQDSVPAAETLRLLAEDGYDVTVEHQEDPDWPRWQLVRNPLKDAVVKLEQQLVDKQELLVGFQQELEKEQQAHQETTKKLEDFKGWLESRKKQVSELESSADQAVKELETLQLKIKEMDTLQLKLNETECKNAERQEQVRELAETNRTITHENKKLKETVAGLEKELVRTEAQISTIKMLMLDQQGEL
ncbi:hypothetical protein ACQUQP_05995 [Marinobacterium sp. YM272]|uniref:hypothetical protein n=1 Tax=Marinobacterium sp. YM272 TaxID=3421654 RepID=UPI003D7FEFFE